MGFDHAQDQGMPAPCAAQLPYSLVRRDWLESAEMSEPLEASGAGVVASFVMAGGILTGKYDTPGATPAAGGGRKAGAGRAAAEIDDPRHTSARERGRRLRALAEEAGASPAALAIAFALANSAVTSVLFGATSAAQIAENVRALEIDAATLARVVAA
jgi:aryl-alcohol dehydrogenase-like predicted oxidoreductase